MHKLTSMGRGMLTWLLTILLVNSIFFSTPPTLANAAQVSIAGIVIYSTVPVANAYVKIYVWPNMATEYAHVLTDANGGFSFSDVPAGNYGVQVYPPAGYYIGHGTMVTVPSDYAQGRILLLVEKGITRLGPPDQGSDVNNPLAPPVENSSPYFCWSGPSEAVKYTFTIHRQSDWALMESHGNLFTNCYTSGVVLPNDTNTPPTTLYNWDVTGYNANGTPVGGAIGDGYFTTKYAPLTVQVEPDAASDLTSTDQSIHFAFPSSMVSTSTTVTYTRESSLPHSSSGLVDLHHSFNLDGGGASISADHPFTVTISYSSSDLATATATTLALYYWDGSQWVKDLTSNSDPTGKTVSATPNHFGVWAVLGETHRMYLPITKK